MKWLIVSALTILSLSLRLYRFENRVPFDWDQNRDYAEVVKIASGQYVPLGPIAKGSVGGFYLGSLYYYLLSPAYWLMQGSLSALPLTSIVIDSLAAGLIYLLLYIPLGRARALAIALLWTYAWFLIEASRISWNVALVPLWSLLTLTSIYQSITKHSVKHFYLLACLAGVTLHLHVATIPMIPLLLLIFFRRLSFPLSVWLKGVLISIIPALPLLTYDLNHNFYNLRLVKDFFSYRKAVTTPVGEMIIPMLTKLGKVTSALFTAVFRDNLTLGIITLLVAVRSLWSKHFMVVLAGAMVLITSVLIMLLRETGFPEYYLTPSYLAIYVVMNSTLVSLLARLGSRGHTILAGIVIALVITNARSYTTQELGFSLSVKEKVVDSLVEYQHPVDLHYNFDPGRDGGLHYLVKLKGVQVDKTSKHRILLTDKLNTPLYIEGELARDLLQIGNIRTALYIVQ